MSGKLVGGNVCQICQITLNDYKTGCHFLFENEFENHESQLPVDSTRILACSFWFWPRCQLLYRLHLFVHLFQEPLSGGLFGSWVSQKWKTWWCHSTTYSDASANCWSPEGYGHRTNSVLELRVLMLSSLLLKQCPTGTGKLKTFYQTS